LGVSVLDAFRESIPTLVSIVVGGLFASILFPRWQASYTRTKTLIERRFALIEAVATQFSAYITAWRRLIQIAILEAERPLTETESARMAGFVAQRNEARDALWASFARGQFYFTEQASDVIRVFTAWDEAQVAKPLADLPDIAEWRQWEARVLAQLKRDERRGGSWR
jgi:hypothetical protein